MNPSSQSSINASPKSSRDNIGNSNNSSATQASGKEIGNSIHDSSSAAQSSDENSSDKSRNAPQPSEYYRSGLILYNTHTLVLTFVCANTYGCFSIGAKSHHKLCNPYVSFDWQGAFRSIENSPVSVIIKIQASKLSLESTISSSLGFEVYLSIVHAQTIGSGYVQY